MLREEHHSQSAANRVSRQVMTEFRTDSASRAVVAHHLSPDGPQTLSFLLSLPLVDISNALAQVVGHVLTVIQTLDTHERLVHPLIPLVSSESHKHCPLVESANHLALTSRSRLPSWVFLQLSSAFF